MTTGCHPRDIGRLPKEGSRAREVSGIEFIELRIGYDGIAIMTSDAVECLTPDSDTIADNTYPISRPLFIYGDQAQPEENPALAAWVDPYLNDGVPSVSEVGYVDLAAHDLAASEARWDARTAGAE